MIKYENDCSGCEYCYGYCNLKQQPHLYCDSCGSECEEVYCMESYDAIYLCEDCLSQLVKRYTLRDLLELEEDT